MRGWLSMLLVASSFAFVGAPAARAQSSQPALKTPSAADEGGIKQDIENLITAFNKKDSEGWATAYDDNGNQNNLRGINNASGHPMIAANYARLFKTSLAKAQDTLTLRPIHMVSPTVAVVDGDCIGGVGNDHDLWEFVMVKRNGLWRIDNFHEYAVGEK